VKISYKENKKFEKMDKFHFKWVTILMTCAVYLCNANRIKNGD
jgi:hypothetical protein